MDKDQVLQVFDRAYAEGYDERFLLTPLRRPHTDFEEQMIRELLPAGGKGRWLDVACGSGYFLARFPGVERAGLEYAPPMLRVASDRNPDATFRQAGFLDAQPDWEGRWDLVSCMGSAYVIVETLSQVRQLIGNLAAWTSRDGACFMPISLCDGLNGARIPYITDSPFGGRFVISAITWTYLERSGEIHPDLIAPHEEWLVETFSRYFKNVERVVYPTLQPDWEPLQRAIVARQKI